DVAVHPRGGALFHPGLEERYVLREPVQLAHLLIREAPSHHRRPEIRVLTAEREPVRAGHVDGGIEATATGLAVEGADVERDLAIVWPANDMDEEPRPQGVR